MQARTRRRFDLVALGVAGLVAGGITVAAASGGNIERVDALHVSAVVRPDGSARVTETYDYNFGHATKRHGLERIVEGSGSDANVSVTSPDAPAAVSTYASTLGNPHLYIRIGDPSRTVSGRHRYVISYDLAGVAPDGELNWNAVGAQSAVPMQDVTVEVVGPWNFSGSGCVRGSTGSLAACTVAAPAPGRLTVGPVSLAAYKGITISSSASTGITATPATALVGPWHNALDTGFALPAGLAVAGSLLAAGATGIATTRRGRDRVGAGGAADAAYGGSAGAEQWMTEHQLEQLATVEFAPPGELTPAQGGIVLVEGVRHEHKVAWLVDQAVKGTIEITGDRPRSMTMTRRAPADGDARLVLDAMLGGKDSISLGTYDPGFATGWSTLGTKLESWRTSSGLWDPAGERRRRHAPLLGYPVLFGGGFLMAVAAAVGFLHRGRWLIGVAAGAALFGAGVALVVRAHVLNSRTVAGSRAWLKVESFRRFLAQSEAEHARQAADRGVLRQYVAWAVAVGEIERWSRAMQGAALAPDPSTTSLITMAPLLGSATMSTSHQPSSSGGSGHGFSGGGFGVGGGVGGGSVGSW